MRVPDAFDGALAGLAAGFLAAGFAAGFLALGEAAFFGLFFGAALGLAGDFLTTVFFFAGLFAFEAGFLAGLFFLAGDLAFEAGFAGDLREGDVDAWRRGGLDAAGALLGGGLGGLRRLGRGLGALLGRRLLGRGPARKCVVRIT